MCPEGLGALLSINLKSLEGERITKHCGKVRSSLFYCVFGEREKQGF